MSIELAAITIDCDDVAKVSRFWAAALGAEVDEGANEWFAIVTPESGPVRFFAKVPEPKTAKNRMHVDFSADDRAAEVERLIGLGATKLADHDEHNVVWTVMADPEGNEFCVADQTAPA